MRCEACGQQPAVIDTNLCAACWQDQVMAVINSHPKMHGYGSRRAARPTTKQPKMVVCSEGHRHKRKTHDRTVA